MLLASPCLWRNSVGLREACAPLTRNCAVSRRPPHGPPKHESLTDRDLRPFPPWVVGPSSLHPHINFTSSASLHRLSAGISLTIYPKLSSLSPPPRRNPTPPRVLPPSASLGAWLAALSRSALHPLSLGPIPALDARSAQGVPSCPFLLPSVQLYTADIESVKTIRFTPSPT